MDESENASITEESDWFWEGNVQSALARQLAAAGWSLLRSSNTAYREQGIDLYLERDGRRLAIEVKGFPSASYARGPNRGQPKRTNPSSQARHWFAGALLAALSSHGTTDDEVAVAFPDYVTYRNLIEKTRRPLQQLGIGIYLVREDGTVEKVIDHLPVPEAR